MFTSRFIEVIVDALHGQKLTVGPTLHHRPFLDHTDQIRGLDGGETMGDDQTGSTFPGFV